MSSRKLKIHSKSQSRAYRKYVSVPEIRLEGKWLEELGFNYGDYVQVTEEENKLTIIVIPSKDE